MPVHHIYTSVSRFRHKCEFPEYALIVCEAKWLPTEPGVIEGLLLAVFDQ